MTHSRSRATSPAPQYTTSHGLQCERLLRDTLRKADAAVARSRANSLSSSRKSRPTTPAPLSIALPASPSYLPPHHSLIADCCSLSDDSDSDDHPTPLRRSRTVGSRSTPTPASMTRSHNPRVTSQSPPSSSSLRTRARSPLSLRHPTPLRPGPLPAARSDPTPTATTSLTVAHEAALRQRLQGVLDSSPVPLHATGAQKALRSVTGPNFSPGHHRESKAHARSRSMSVRGDNGARWESSSPAVSVTYPRETRSQRHPIGPAPPSPARSRAPVLLLEADTLAFTQSPSTGFSSRSVSRSRHTSSRESLSASAASISASASGPSTPPSPSPARAQLDLSQSPQLHLRRLPALGDMPSTSPLQGSSPQTPERPKFDLRTASQLCRTAPGLVSFRDVEGLGAPNHFYDADDDDEEHEHGKGWLASAWGWSPFKRSPGAKTSAEDGANMQHSLSQAGALAAAARNVNDATPTKAAPLTGTSV